MYSGVSSVQSFVLTALLSILSLPSAFLETASSVKTARQMETGSSTQLGRKFALGNQTGSIYLYGAFFFSFSYNLNWHHSSLTLQQGLCGLNIMFIFPCTSSLEIDGFTPTWKLVGMETIQKMIRELEAFWNWAQPVLSHCFIVLMKLVLAGVS